MAKRRIAIVGGGAAGLAAAITAARMGAHVILLEHKDRVGKKILATGNGRCNYTNAKMDPSCFYAGCQRSGGDSMFITSLLEKFPTERVLDFFAEIGVEPAGRSKACSAARWGCMWVWCQSGTWAAGMGLLNT